MTKFPPTAPDVFLYQGNIGSAAITGLVHHGYSVGVHDKFNNYFEKNQRPGLTWFSSPTTLACNSDVLLTCLPGPRDVISVMENDGVLRAMRVGSIWLAHESTDPEEAERWGALSASIGIRMLEAPLTGGIELIRQFTFLCTDS